MGNVNKIVTNPDKRYYYQSVYIVCICRLIVSKPTHDIPRITLTPIYILPPKTFAIGKFGPYFDELSLYQEF